MGWTPCPLIIAFHWRSGDIQRRIYFLKELKEEALQFDLKHFDIVRTVTRRLGDRLNPKVFFEWSSPELERMLDTLHQQCDIEVEERESLVQISNIYHMLKKYEKVCAGVCTVQEV